MQLRQYIRQVIIAEAISRYTKNVFDMIIERFPETFKYPGPDYYYHDSVIPPQSDTDSEFVNNYRDNSVFRNEMHNSFIYHEDKNSANNLYFIDAKCSAMFSAGAGDAYTQKLQTFDVLIDGVSTFSPPDPEEGIEYHQISNDRLLKYLKIARTADEFMVLVLRTMKAVPQ